ncbi:MAG: Nre family DNA repair protein, partial [Candidatus Poseidoniales archaeon]
MFPECIDCRGVRSMCGINPCPLLSQVSKKLPTYEISAFDEMVGPSPPSVFIGRYGY